SPPCLEPGLWQHAGLGDARFGTGVLYPTDHHAEGRPRGIGPIAWFIAQVVMLFFITMAWRETRAAWRHFLYFFFCIALGVGTLVGVGLFAANVEGTVAREARG